ncbi:MAG: MFS transporter, partial [Flavobacterium sp.]
HKNAVFIGSLGFIFTFIAGAMTTICAENPTYTWCQERSYIYGINILCAIINGFFSGILWISVNRYITACSNRANEGRFMGIFSALFSCSNVTGSLVAAYVIKHFGQFHFYLTACAISCLAMVMVYFAPEVHRYDKEHSEQESFREKSLKVIKLSYSPRMRTFLLFLVFVGIVCAVSAGFEYKIILSTIPNMSKEDQNAVTALVFVVQGLVTIIFSYVVGDLADMFKLSYVINGFLMTNFIAIGLSFLSYYMHSLVLAYVMAGFWGLAFSSTATLTGIVMMKDFNGSLESFALLQLLNNFATVLGYGMCIWITDIVTFLYVILGMLIVTQISTFMYKSPEKSKEEKIY